MAFSVAMSVVKDEFLAADVVQEAFIIAFEKLSYFKGNSKFSTWFFRIVINQSFKSIQKNSSQYSESDEALETDTTGKVSTDEQKFFINECLKNMPANESLVLRLFYLNENSLLEVSEITGWSESKVKVTLHRARKTMEKKLVRLLKHEINSLY